VQASAPVSAREALQRSLAKQRASVALQRQAAQAQAENAGASLSPAVDAAYSERGAEAPQVAAPCEPLQETAIGPLVEEAAKAQTVSSRLLRAVIARESGFRPCAVSPKGAQGLMQLMPATSRQFTVKDAFDPEENVGTGARYLKQLLDKYNGDVSLALGAYNAGPGAVDQAGGIPDFAETREYVRAILEDAGIKLPGPPSSPMPKPIEN
jgi:soluble lytic murein transglycosylase-like protein